MAIRLEDEYPTRSTAADAAYPHGSFKNKVTSVDRGTPFEKAWANDIWGFLQALLVGAGITPSGDPDTAIASQYLTALYNRVLNYAKSTADVNSVMRRDANGRTQTADAAAAADVVNLGQADARYFRPVIFTGTTPSMDNTPGTFAEIDLALPGWVAAVHAGTVAVKRNSGGSAGADVIGHALRGPDGYLLAAQLETNTGDNNPAVTAYASAGHMSLFLRNNSATSFAIDYRVVVWCVA